MPDDSKLKIAARASYASTSFVATLLPRRISSLGMFGRPVNQAAHRLQGRATSMDCSRHQLTAYLLPYNLKQIRCYNQIPEIPIARLYFGQKLFFPPIQAAFQFFHSPSVCFRFALRRGLAILLCHCFRFAIGSLRGVRGDLAILIAS